MKCEEFESVGWELARQGGGMNATDAAGWMAATEHAGNCPRCARLLDSWREARVELRELRKVTERVETPARVEMRLRQEFRTKHRTVKARSAGMIAAWTLASAALVVGAVSWRNWSAAGEHGRVGDGRITGAGVTGASSGAVGSGAENESNTNTSASDAGSGATLSASTEQAEFTPVPGSLGQENYDSTIVRVRMQRGALEALGFPVNEERATDWIQVDLLLGEDGQPQGVRLAPQRN